MSLKVSLNSNIFIPSYKQNTQKAQNNQNSTQKQKNGTKAKGQFYPFVYNYNQTQTYQGQTVISGQQYTDYSNPIEYLICQFQNQCGCEEETEEEMSLYKTEMCKNWVQKGSCRYGIKCQFAHGEEELIRKDPFIYKYKKDYCQSYYTKGFCPYGQRCLFIHEYRTFEEVHQLSYTCKIFKMTEQFQNFEISQAIQNSKLQNRLKVFRDIKLIEEEDVQTQLSLVNTQSSDSFNNSKNKSLNSSPHFSGRSSRCDSYFSQKSDYQLDNKEENQEDLNQILEQQLNENLFFFEQDIQIKQ